MGFRSSSPGCWKTFQAECTLRQTNMAKTVILEILDSNYIFKWSSFSWFFQCYVSLPACTPKIEGRVEIDIPPCSLYNCHLIQNACEPSGGTDLLARFLSHEFCWWPQNPGGVDTMNIHADSRPLNRIPYAESATIPFHNSYQRYTLPKTNSSNLPK